MNCVNSVNTPPQCVPPHCWIHIVSDLFMPPLSSFGGVSFCLVPTWNIYPESIVIQCSITMGFAVQAQSKVCPSPKIVQNKSKSKVNPGFVQSIFLIRWKYLESKHNPIFVQTLSSEPRTWILSGESLDNNAFYSTNAGPGLDKPWTWTWIGLTLDTHWIKIGLSLDWISNICPTNRCTGVPKAPITLRIFSAWRCKCSGYSL